MALEQDFQEIFSLTRVGDTRFETTVGGEPGGVLFGGYTLGLTLTAAASTVGPSMWPESLHAYFVDGGVPGTPMAFDVSHLRDTRSFAMRQVEATQGQGRPMSLMAAFHAGEAGPDWSPVADPGVPAPEDLAETPSTLHYLGMDPVEFRSANAAAGSGEAGAMMHVHPYWAKPRIELGADRMLHAAAVAFTSDYLVTGSAYVPGEPHKPGTRVVTIGHSLWFHRPLDANDWLLYQSEPLSLFHGRAVCKGSISTRDGELVASFAQEVLTRAPRD